MKTVVIHNRRRLFDDFFAIDEAKLQFMRSYGNMSRTVRRLSFERRDSVTAVLFDVRESRVMLVRQFRFPTLDKGPGWIVQALAGILQPGESPEEALRREVLEEVGYCVGAIGPIAQFYLSPGGSSDRTFLYCAEIASNGRVETGGGAPDEDEDSELVELALQQVPKAIEDGTVCDAKTLVGLLWLLQRYPGAASTTQAPVRPGDTGA